MTVSLALRNQSGVSEETRKRIRKIALKLDYHPDAMLASLSAYRRVIKPPAYTGTLGWITMESNKDEWKHGWSGKLRMHQGAYERANKLGYKLDEFWFNKDEMTAQRFSSILKARNIRGLIFLSTPGPGKKLDMNWSQFSCVGLGYTLSEPQFHAINDDSGFAVNIALRKLKESGHKKIGMTLSAVAHEKVMEDWIGSYYQSMHRMFPGTKFRILTKDRIYKEDFLKWLDKNQPDSLISHAPELVVRWLNEEGYKVPGDISLTGVGVEPDQRFAGVTQNSLGIGQSAVDALVGMIHRDEVGVPESPLRILLEGHWMDGNTIARRQ